VFGLTDRQFFQIAVLIYGGGLVYALAIFRHGFHKAGVTLHTILGTAVVFHTISMVLRGLALGRCPVTNLYEATAFTAWTISMACVGLGIVPRLRFLAVLGTPVLFALGVFALMPRMDTQATEPQLERGMMSLHMSLTLLAYGAFGMAALLSTMYLAQEHELKLRKSNALTARLPALEQLDTTGPRLVAIGLALLSAGLLIGMAWLKRQQGVYLKADPKIIWAIFVWILYALLLGLRRRYGLRGRRFAWPSVTCFAFVLLTYWGFNLLSDIHNPR